MVGVGIYSVNAKLSVRVQSCKSYCIYSVPCFVLFVLVFDTVSLAELIERNHCIFQLLHSNTNTEQCSTVQY